MANGKIFFGGRLQRVLTGVMLIAGISMWLRNSQAQTCDPFEVNVEMEMELNESSFPYNSEDFPVFFLVTTDGCNSHPNAEFCSGSVNITHTLLNQGTALTNKCEQLVNAIKAQCNPRFDVSEDDCATSIVSGDATATDLHVSFTVKDTSCSVLSSNDGDGIGFVLANTASGLHAVQCELPQNCESTPSDYYERDTITRSCEATRGNIAVLKGQSTGTSFVDGVSDSSVTATLTVPGYGTVRAHRIIVENAIGVNAKRVVNLLVDELNCRLFSFLAESPDVPEFCQSLDDPPLPTSLPYESPLGTCVQLSLLDGPSEAYNAFGCVAVSGNNVDAGMPLDTRGMTLTVERDDPGFQWAIMAGEQNRLVAMINAIKRDSCTDLLTDCPGLASQSVPLLPTGDLGLGALLVGLGIIFAQRRRS